MCVGRVEPLRPEDLFVRILVKADHERLPHKGCWGTEIPRGTDEVCEQCRLVRGIAFEVELHDLLPPNRHELIGFLHQFQRRRRVIADFGGLLRREYFPTDGLKEPLSFLARRSGLALVQPIDLLHRYPYLGDPLYRRQKPPTNDTLLSDCASPWTRMRASVRRFRTVDRRVGCCERTGDGLS